MSENLLKTSVYTNEVVFSETLEQPIDADFSLPDYYPDIRKVLKCKAIPRITNKNLSGNNLSFDGVVSVTIFYCDDNGKINAFEYSSTFEKSKELGNDVENARITVTPKCEYINCRAISNRKIDIHGAISISVIAQKKISTEIISDIEDKNIEILRDFLPATSPTGYAEKYILIEEECEIGDENGGDIILRYDADAKIGECKTTNGKVIVKGEVVFNLRFSANGEIKCMQNQIPFSQILDIETIGENCEAETEAIICFLDAKPKTDKEGKFKSVALNIKLLLSAETYCVDDIPIIIDAYSRKKKSEVSKNNISVKKMIKKINEVFSCKKKIDIEEGNISSVIDNWCDIKITGTKISDKTAVINGNVIASFITSDTDNTSRYFEKIIEFEYKYSIDTDYNNLSISPKIYINSCGYTILGENSLEIRCELNVCASIFVCSNTEAVNNLKIYDTPNEYKPNDSAMVIYFASKGERLWDIAKKYCSSGNDIKKLNEMTEDKIPETLSLLIPIE